MPNTGPLKDIRVLELGTLVAGPYCSRIFAEFGAEVIKVERPRLGDPIRTWGQLTPEGSLWSLLQSRNKKCITLNLRLPEGQALARELAKHCDVLIENFRPGKLEEWGLGYESLHNFNPRLVMVRISGWGQTGPYKDRVGFGSIGEAVGGLRYITGYPDQCPTRVGVSLGDTLAGLYAVIGALMALHARDQGSGEGQYIDVALNEAVFSVLDSAVPDYDYAGVIRERTGTSLPSIAPSNTYATKDGEWILIAGNSDTIFSRLSTLIGRPELAADPRFHSNENRVENARALDDMIQAWVDQYSADEALYLLDEADVPASKIYSIADICADEHYQVRNMVPGFEHPRLGKMRVPGIVPKLSVTPGSINWLGRRLGEDNAEIYHGLLGLSETDLQALAERGAI
jgi:crotonobetainyl-CoA:carnitine CoA-transferase CaiB-like acyl-CoA transferase